jgi:hypothetical protein
MRRAVRAGLIGAALLLGGPTGAQPERTEPLHAQVAVERNRAEWTADFAFGKDSPVWAFHASGLTRVGSRSWRAASWTVETPGVRLERRGFYDALVAERGTVPRRVRIRFRPFGEDLLSNYDPALIFTDGGVALFSDQFDLFPVSSAATTEKLPLQLASGDVEPGLTSVTFRDRHGRILHQGQRKRTVTLTNGRAYVLFGGGAPGRDPSPRHDRRSAASRLAQVGAGQRQHPPARPLRRSAGSSARRQADRDGELGRTDEGAAQHGRQRPSGSRRHDIRGRCRHARRPGRQQRRPVLHRA